MPGVQIGSSVRPCAGHQVGGDLIALRELEGGTVVAIIDALGHGVEAHRMAKFMKDWLERSATSDVVATLRRLDQVSRGQRGAAVGICHLNPEDGLLQYAGVGNTVIRRFGSSEEHLVSRDGLVGYRMGAPLLQTLVIESGDVVVLHTDGVTTQFTLAEYPHLIRDDIGTVAATLVEKFGHSHDDAGCVVLRRD